jgi:lipoprotein-releasing system ATP-binding protein
LPILEGQNIQKSYDQLHVLKGVDINVLKGEIVAIVGKSGAGKSTLLHILGTLDQPDAGDVRIDGTSVHRLSGRAAADFRNKQIGFVFQFHHLLNEFTAVENVAIPAMIQQMPRSAMNKRSEELLDYLGLSDRLRHKPTELSGGEQQRVAIARALMNSPAIIMADEPTGNLDTETSRELHALFLQLRDDFQQTFILVTHNEELAAMSDRTLHMRDGVFVKGTQSVS